MRGAPQFVNDSRGWVTDSQTTPARSSRHRGDEPEVREDGHKCAIWDSNQFPPLVTLAGVTKAAIASARHLATIRRVCASADGLHNQTVRLLEALAERLYAASARPLRAKKLRTPAKRRQR